MGTYDIVGKYFLSKIQKVPTTNEKTDTSDYIKIETSVNKTPQTIFLKSYNPQKDICNSCMSRKHVEKNTNYSIEKQQRNE